MNKRLVLVLSLVVLIGAGDALGELVGYWKLDEGGGTKALDSSGKGNDGTIVNKPTWIAGVNGGALEFHGLGVSGGGGDYINCGTKAVLDVRGPISIAVWLKPQADEPEGKATETAPMAKADAIAGWSWQLRYGWGSSKPFMGFQFEASPSSGLGLRQPEPGARRVVPCRVLPRRQDGEMLSSMGSKPTLRP